MQKNEGTIREYSLNILLTGLLFFGSIALFAFLAHQVVLREKDLFDSNVYNYISRFGGSGTREFMRIISFFGSQTFLLPAYCLLVGWLLIRGQKRWAVNIGIVAITSTVALHAMKRAFQRPRPDMPLFDTLHNYSFPSGHALSAFVFSSVLIYLIKEQPIRLAWKWVIGVLLILLALLIGFSRIYLRYHYASDVIGGFCLGMIWVQLSLWLQNRLHASMNRKTPDTVLK